LVNGSTGYPQDAVLNSLKNEMLPTLICNDPSITTTSTAKAVTYGGATKYEIDQFAGATCSSGYSKDYVRLLTASEYYNLSYRTPEVTSVFSTTSVPFVPIAKIGYMPEKVASTNTWLYNYNFTTTATSGTNASYTRYALRFAYNNASGVSAYLASSSAGYSPVVVVQYNSSITPAASYTVTFNTNGGSSIESQRVYQGNTVVKPTNPTRDGYEFVNWYSDSSLTTTYNFSTVVTSNMTLYAKWEPISCATVEARCTPQCHAAASNCQTSCSNAGGTSCGSSCNEAFGNCMRGCYSTRSSEWGLSCTYGSSGSGSGGGSSSVCTDGDSAPVAGTTYTDWCISSCGQGTTSCYEIATCSNGQWDYSGASICGPCTC
jgi:uncharacterized repeat protein (TIGR02543 family)